MRTEDEIKMSKRYTLIDFSFTVDDEILEELENDVDDWEELSQDEKDNLVYDKV